MNTPHRRFWARPRTFARAGRAASASLVAWFALPAATALADADVVQGGNDAAPDVVSTLVGLVPYVLMAFVVYFFLLRPANKQRQAQQELLQGLKKDDEVVTQSGIVGRIVALEETLVVLEVADRVKVRMLRSSVSGPYAGKPVAAASRGSV